MPHVSPGHPRPLGARVDADGVNFALFSEVAEKVELCLFDDGGREERVTLPEMSGFIWHGHVAGVRPGQRYGFRVHGPWAPERGARCNPAKLLLDPYARAIDGGITWGQPVFGYDFAQGTDVPDHQDSAASVPRSVVVDEGFDWGGDVAPDRPMHETIVYEAHVRGLTMRHPGVPEELLGTYAGLATDAVVGHLRGLGVTAIELLPVHHFVHPQHLVEKGLRNYWGYDSIGYFAPHAEYAVKGRTGTDLVREFKCMVRELHAAGIEVILDVVYNHTAEGNENGPTLSLRGIDAAAYYRLDPADPRRHVDYTGTGNSLNMQHPHVLQLIMDSLRYWITEMHVDGFRFDLAATLARELHDVDRLGSFFDIIHQDPVISSVKLIAEPWDLGQGGYQVGNFPPLWSEWNGKYRDCVRDYWRGADETLAEFASRFTGSSDLYAEAARRPHASVNFVTAHDGFTLRDLVSYDGKHNEANGEDNRDGESHNRSWNCGVEGPTDDPAILALRARQQRNFLVTLFLSQGVPMLLHGDETGRTQGGNNNAYCQDNEVAWLDWEGADQELLEFTRRLVALRKEHPVFHRRRWFHGRPIHGSDVKDLAWFDPSGAEMTEEQWQSGFAKALGVYLNGESLQRRGTDGARVVDDDFLVLFNAHHEPVAFTLPPEGLADRWELVLASAQDAPAGPWPARAQLQVEARAVVVLVGR